MSEDTDKYPLIGEDRVIPAKCGNSSTEEGQDWIETFRKGFKIEHVKVQEDGYHLEFDMVGSQPYLANSLRRILIAEVPTMAISCVNMIRNTSVMQDEILAHRLGLVPFKAPAKLFEYHKEEEKYTDENSVTYEISVRGKKRTDGAAARNTVSDVTSVLSSDIKCRYTDGLLRKLGVDPANADEKKRVIESDPCGPLHLDILIMKLAEGHEISATMAATKSTGTDHARHSPVSTAFYRFQPIIRLVDPSPASGSPGRPSEGWKKYVKRLVLPSEDAELFQKSFNVGVIDRKPYKKDGFEVVTVANPRMDKYSRNIFKHDHLREHVEVAIKTDHQIFTVQSESAYSAEDLVLQAIDIFRQKCDALLESAEALAID